MRDKLKQKEYNKIYYDKNRSKSQQYYVDNKERILKQTAKYRLEHKEETSLRENNRHRAVRLAVLSYYSGGKVVCSCCSELELKFLSLDHINGGGNIERKEHGRNLYRYLVKSGYPKGYQVLCHNCNLAKGFYGMCPHKE